MFCNKTLQSKRERTGHLLLKSQNLEMANNFEHEQQAHHKVLSWLYANWVLYDFQFAIQPLHLVPQNLKIERPLAYDI